MRNIKPSGYLHKVTDLEVTVFTSFNVHLLCWDSDWPTNEILARISFVKLKSEFCRKKPLRSKMKFALFLATAVSLAGASNLAIDIKACESDVSEAMRDISGALTTLWDIKGDCISGGRESCADDLEKMLDGFDNAAHAAEKALGDCANMEETTCEADLVKLIDDLDDCSRDVKAIADDCHWNSLVQCFDDAEEAATALYHAGKDIQDALGQCKMRDEYGTDPRTWFKSVV